ncbi:molybdopterin oxidoreductase family protein [Saccharibacillus alkalitolerans]|uniref:Molybdopterin oxidoreductase family protein n=1 Tax=Saccharibacillus alkalitolerans TaxID=2705290 RepID=A0ABX0FC25_9BACL|nr:molybdopterin oxidoreductase family protein [Saccharibacillus alkalitolerans]NGZ75597.1 molybdopterin oxidoreductase family protein [Saccharibacillus alkalitolerans]
MSSSLIGKTPGGEPFFAGRTQCPFCSVQCKIRMDGEAKPEGLSAFRAHGDDNAASEGRLCVKGQNAHQHALSGERLLHPMVRRGGKLVRATWEEAMRTAVGMFAASAEEGGPDAVGVYGGGSLSNESAYLLGKFARLALGTRYIDYNGRFCMSAAASAGSKTFGVDRGLTFRLSDIPKAECIVLAGTNLAECQPTLMPYFNRARENGASIIVIDPRATATAAASDLHLPVRPGTDAALAAGMLKVLIEEGLIDEAFVESRTRGFEELRERAVNQMTLPQTAEFCGVREDLIRRAATMYGRARTGMIMTARGVEQQTDGHLAVREFLNLVLATGKIGREGCGYGAITGQGNGQGGREHGQKADQLPGYRSIADEADRAYVASVWGVEPERIPGPGVSAYEMMEMIDRQEIRTLLVMGSNPVVSNPNVSRVREGLEKLDGLIVADMFLSETALLADVVLPVTSYLENEGTLTNLEGRVLLREAVRPAPGECRHDWAVLGDFAERLGRAEGFRFRSAEAIFDELRLASRGGRADYYGITYDRLRREEGVYWPCGEAGGGSGLMFERSFAHADGRAVFSAPPQNTENGRTTSSAYPLLLTNGRVLAHYLTGVQTHRSPVLEAREVANFLEIHPAAAKRIRVRDGEWARIDSEAGMFYARCRVTDKIREDTVFAPMHWSGSQNVNRATLPDLDPYCKMPGFKTTPVRVLPYGGSSEEDDRSGLSAGPAALV